MRIGVVGCGNICPIYLENLERFGHPVEAVADLDPSRASAMAERFSVPRSLAPDELLADPAIALVVNLTTPGSHAPLNQAALRAGKHVYVEKPLGLSAAEADETIRLAESLGLTVGCAPDTVLGAGIQTARHAVDHGLIGTPVGFNAFMLCPGHERWHPNPEFYYQPGGGPLFDMGPYYLAALATLLGPFRRVAGFTSTPSRERTLGAGDRKGQSFPVHTPTTCLALLETVGGAIGQFSSSFDVWHNELPHLELYGTEGSLSVPDPNGFGGIVRFRGAHDDDWKPLPLTHPHAENSRGLGVVDQIAAIQEGREVRASGRLGAHLVEVMEAVLKSSEDSRARLLRAGVVRPTAMPAS